MMPFDELPAGVRQFYLERARALLDSGFVPPVFGKWLKEDYMSTVSLAKLLYENGTLKPPDV